MTPTTRLAELERLLAKTTTEGNYNWFLDEAALHAALCNAALWLIACVRERDAWRTRNNEMPTGDSFACSYPWPELSLAMEAADRAAEAMERSDKE